MKSSRNSLVILALAGLVVLAATLRWAHLTEISRVDFFAVPGMTPDAEYNHDWGLRRCGLAPPAPSTPYYVTPLYPEYLGLVYRLFGPRPAAGKTIQILLGSLNVLLMYWMARRVGDRRVALLAAALCALYPMYIFYEAALIKTSLTIFLVLLALGLLLAAAERHGRAGWRWLPAGVAVSLVCLVRANVLLFVPLAVLAALWTQRRAGWRRAAQAAGFLALGSMLGLAPVTIHNAAVGKGFLLICSNGGFNFYIGNNPEARAWFTPVNGIDTNLAGEERDTRRVAERELGESLRPSEVSAYWRGQARAFIREHPLSFLRLAATKFLFVLNAVEIPNTENYYFTRGFSRVLRLPLPSYGVLLPFGVLGMIVCWRRAPLTLWLNLFLLANLVGLMVVYVVARYRLPMTPVILLYAAAGIVWLIEAVRDRRRQLLPPALLLLVVVLGVSYAPFPKLAAMFRTNWSQPLLTAGRYYQYHSRPHRALEVLNQIPEAWGRQAEVLEMIGACKVDLGQYDDARRALDRSIELAPEAASAHFHRARLAFETGDYALAETDLQYVVLREPDRAIGHYHLGKVYRARQQHAPAIVSLETARQLDPDLIDAYAELALAYQAHGEPARAAKVLQAGLARHPEDARLQELRARIGEE